MSNQDTMPFTKEIVRAYLDLGIRKFRHERDFKGSGIAQHYIDAFQSVRATLFGEVLREDNGMGNYATNREPDPQAGEIDITSLVVEDLEARAKTGEKKYGTRLQAFNGRNVLVDAYQEVLDLAVYIKQELIEQENLR